MPARRQVVLYVTSDECPLCDEAEALLDEAALSLPIDVHVVEVDADPALSARHRLRVPVIEVDGREALFGKVRRADLLRALEPPRSAEGGPRGRLR
jgi:hypothetical protein